MTFSESEYLDMVPPGKRAAGWRRGCPDATAGGADADVASRRNGQSFQALAAQRTGCAGVAGAVHAWR